MTERAESKVVQERRECESSARVAAAHLGIICAKDDIKDWSYTYKTAGRLRTSTRQRETEGPMSEASRAPSSSASRWGRVASAAGSGGRF